MSEDSIDEGPGLPGPLSTWRGVYVAVLIHLLVWVAVFVILTEVYR